MEMAKAEVIDRVRTFVLSLQPNTTAKGVLVTIPINDNPASVIVSTDRHKRDVVKDYIIKEYHEKYGVKLSYTLCASVLKEVIKALQLNNSIWDTTPATNDTTPVTTITPATNDTTPVTSTSTKPYEDFTSDDNELDPTPLKGVFLHRKSNIVLQQDKNTGAMYPIKEWSIPVVHTRYQNTDHQGNTKVEYDLSINGHRQTIDRMDVSNGKYISRYPDLSNVETPYLKNTYATLISSEARKAPLMIRVKTTGVYPYTVDDMQRLGYMYPTGKFLQSDGTFYPHTSLSRTLPTGELERWSRYDEHVQATPEEIQELYTFIKGVSPTGVGLILLANNARSLAHFLTSDTFRCGHAVYLYGEQGSGKTELSSFCRGLVYPYVNKAPLDATFRDTGSSVEDDIDFCKDIPAIIDDLVKAPTDSDSVLRRMEKVLESIGRSSYDGMPIRKRMTQSMSKQYSRHVRTLPIVTGEKYAHTMPLSGHRRVLSIEVQKSDIHRTSLEANSPYSLDNSEKHTYTLYALGRHIILDILRNAEKDRDKFIHQLEQRYKNFQQRVYDSVTAIWKQRQSIPFPHFADSLIEICSHILVGARLIDYASSEQTTCVEDVFMPLIHMLYTHLCKMSNVSPHNDSLSSLDISLIEMYEGMAKGRTVKVHGNSETLKAEAYTAKDVPLVSYEHGEIIPATQWGHSLESTPKSKVAMYVRPEIDKLYLTSVGLQAILHLLSESEEGKHIDSTSLLSQQFIKEQWIAEDDRGDGIHIQKKIRRFGECERVLVISLSKFLKLVDAGVEEDATTQISSTDNIIQYPSKHLSVDSILAN